jgi:hypothetical protein
MPTSPLLPTRWFQRFQAGRWVRSGSFANASSCSTLRQYCTIIGPPGPIHEVKCSRPRSGCLLSSRSIGPMAAATGSHLCSFHHLLTRMPIRKTTKSPANSAVT